MSSKQCVQQCCIGVYMMLSVRVLYSTHTAVCVCSAPDDFHINPGAVEAILQHPTQTEKVLIIYAPCF